MRKNTAQRRKILLTAWPGMSEKHRPDGFVATSAAAKGLREADGYVPDYMTWSFSFVYLFPLMKTY